MDVTKVIGIVARIPKHFSLHFYDFSTILYGIYKFAVFENKRKRKQNFAVGPLERIGDSQTCPWPEPRTEEAAAGRISASSATGGEGEQGEEQEGGESNLLVGSDRVGSGRRRRPHGAAAPAEVAHGGGGAPAKGSGGGRA